MEFLVGFNREFALQNRFSIPDRILTVVEAIHFGEFDYILRFLKQKVNHVAVTHRQLWSESFNLKLTSKLKPTGLVKQEREKLFLHYDCNI